jgi:hypothetical protein
MAGVLEEEIDDWAQAIARLHEITAGDPGDARVAGAVASQWSGFGYQNAPLRVLLVQAIEVGYMTALKDVRDGDLDDEIRMWRPGLSDA